MVATVQGGIVRVRRGGQVMGSLSANTEAGALLIHGPQGSLAAAVTGTEESGKLAFFNVDWELTSALP